jgi:hypothetical protein
VGQGLFVWLVPSQFNGNAQRHWYVVSAIAGRAATKQSPKTRVFARGLRRRSAFRNDRRKAPGC